MTLDERYRGPWCTVCGGPGEVTIRSLTPERPIGRCTRGAPDQKGCGRVILTYDEPEAGRVFDQRRRRLATSRHPVHLRVRHPNPYCDECHDAIVRANPLSHE